jgi:hypothetical protein
LFTKGNFLFKKVRITRIEINIFLKKIIKRLRKQNKKAFAFVQMISHDK